MNNSQNTPFKTLCTLNRLESFLLAKGLLDDPRIVVPHPTFHRLPMPLKQSMRYFFEKESREYFQRVSEPTSSRQAGFIFDTYFGPMAVVICYEGLKPDLLKEAKTHKNTLHHTLYQTASDNSDNNAYKKATVHGFCFEGGQPYLNRLLGHLAYPPQCQTFDFDPSNDILFSESLSDLLFYGPDLYEFIQKRITAPNAVGIYKDHVQICVHAIIKMINRMNNADEVRKIINLLAILIKYTQVHTAWLRIQKSDDMDPKKLLAVVDEFRKKFFKQHLAGTSSLYTGLSIMGLRPLLVIFRGLHFFHSEKFIAALTTEKMKREEILRQWYSDLQNKVPEESLQEKIVQALSDVYDLSYANLTSQLTAFAVRQTNRHTGGLLSAQSMQHVERIASLIGAVLGLFYMSTLDPFSLLSTTGIVFVTERLHKNLRQGQFNLSRAWFNSGEAILPSFAAMLRIALLLFSSVMSIYFNNSSYLQDMILTLGTTALLGKLFRSLISDGMPKKNADLVFFEFLFIQICLASIQDIKNRYALRETITNQLSSPEISRNTHAEFSGRWWFFSPQFRLTNSNETHIREMVCQPTAEITALSSEIDVRGLASCTLQEEYPMLLRPV